MLLILQMHLELQKHRHLVVILTAMPQIWKLPDLQSTKQGQWACRGLSPLLVVKSLSQ